MVKNIYRASNLESGDEYVLRPQENYPTKVGIADFAKKVDIANFVRKVGIANLEVWIATLPWKVG